MSCVTHHYVGSTVATAYPFTQGSCARGCYPAMLSNNQCDSACLNSACNNDSGECSSTACHNGCYAYMLGDGVCQSACQVAACGWDSADCDCATGCFPPLRTNAVCDAACDTASCRYDGGLCVTATQGNCASKCYTAMVGDTHCDSVCNNALCGWDAMDCGCAAHCDSADYGNCKAECLVASCNYDAMPGFSQCADPQLRTAALYYHLAKGNFSLPYSLSALCSSTACDWASSSAACVAGCNSAECGLSLGNCVATSACSLAANCLTCALTGVGGCLRCAPGFYHLGLSCVAKCPTGYYLHPLVTALCYPLDDTTTFAAPFPVYVTANSNPSGVGSYTDPYASIALAFDSLRMKFTVIYLLAGTHTLTATTVSPFLKPWSQLSTAATAYSALNVTVKGFTCAMDSHSPVHSECATSSPALRIDNLSPVVLRVVGTMWFVGVDFLGSTTLLSGCSTAQCLYCPNITLDAAGNGVDDRGTVLVKGTFAPASACSSFLSKSLITVDSGVSLTFENLTIADFRQGYGSLITLSSAQLTFRSVVFRNIVVGMKTAIKTGTTFVAQEAVVSQSYSSSELYLPGKVLFDSVVVTLLNNGYEFSADQFFGGFLNSKGIEKIEITNSNFTLSVLPRSILINVGNLLRFILRNCHFDTLYTGQNLLRITSIITISSLPDALNDHIAITNVTFSRCAASHPVDAVGYLLLVVYNSPQINALLENITVTETFSVASAISVINFGTILATDKTGQTVVTRTATSRTVSVFPQRWVRVKNMSLESSVVSSVSLGLVYISGVVNVEMAQVTVTNSGDYGTSESVNTKMFRYYAGQQGVYQSRLATDMPRVHCSKVINFQRAYNITIADVTVSNCQCLDSTGSTGLNAGGAMTGDFAVTRFRMYSTTSVSPSLGNCVNAVSPGNVFISNIDIRDNVMGAGGCVKVAGSTALGNYVSQAQFVNNTSQGAMVQVIAAAFLLSDSAVAGTVSTSQAGVLFQASAGLASARLNITTSTFTRNSGSLGTAIYVTNDLTTASPVLLSVTRCEFSLNSATTAASVLYVDSTNPMAAGSTVAGSTFLNNTSPRGAVSVAYNSGSLMLSRNTFEYSKVPVPVPLTGKIGSDVGCLEALFQLQTKTLPSLTVQDCEFRYNQGSSVIKLSTQNESTTLYCTRCTFTGNSGRSFSLERGTVVNSLSVFSGNSGGAFIATLGATAQVSDSVMRDNAGYWAGVAYFGGTSSARFQNCTMERNRGQSAGALYIEQSSLLVMVDCTLRKNVAQVRGSAVFLFGSVAANSIASTVIEDNESADSAAVMCLSSALTLDRVVLRRNKAPVAPGILAYISSLVIKDCTFADQHSVSGTFIYSAIDSEMTISGSSFSAAFSDSVGGAIYVNSARVTISRSTFSEIQALAGALLYGDANSTLQLSTSQVTNVHSTSEQGGVVFINDGHCSLSATNIESYTNGGLVVLGRSYLSMFSVSFAQGNNTQGGAVYCSECMSLRIESSIFANVSAMDGAAVFLTRQRTQPEQFLIVNCVFVNITGTLSGAVYLSNTDVLIAECEFRRTRATGYSEVGNGGAVKVQCTDATKVCQVTIENCGFSDNAAATKGGSVYWEDSMPVLRNNTFLRGTALYGPDVASFPVGIELHGVAGNASVERLGTDTAGVNVVGVLRNLASGQICEHMIAVTLIDHYGQKVQTDTGTAGTLSAGSETASVFGGTTAYSLNGSFSFSGFGVSAPPGKDTFIHISVAGIASSGNASLSRVLALKGEMRECTIGESLAGIQCVSCPEGKYSLDPKDSCQSCPAEALCYGNYSMVPKKGYWRSGVLSTVFWRCPYEDACRGSPEPPGPLSYSGLCATGYYGNLCNGCANGFARAGKAKCSFCPSLLSNCVKISCIAVGALIAVAVIVKTAISSARKSSSHYSIFLKILLNYLQLVMLTATFQLEWPDYVQQMFTVQESAGNVSEHVFSFDCLLDTSSADAQARTVRTKLLVFAFLPIGLFAASFAFWLPISLVRRKPYYKNEFVTTNIVLFFLVHPNIVKATFNFFSCRRIDNKYWLESFLNIPCWDTLHYRYALAAALPSILLWGVGTPLVCLLVLVKGKNRLSLIEMKIRLGFVFNGFNSSKYYWEFVILYQKLAIISISVFLSTVSVSLQGLTVMVVLLAAFGLQVKHKPFAVQMMNDLEAKAILVAAVTIYCGLYYMTSSLDFNTQIVMFAVIVCANVYFLSFWMYRFVRTGFGLLRRKLPCLNSLFRRFSKVHVLKASTIPGSSALGNSEFMKSSEVNPSMGRGYPNQFQESDLNESSFHRLPGIAHLEGRYRVPDNSRSEVSQSMSN